MASIHRTTKSKFWHCSFYDPAAGNWRLRSTRTADKAAAEATCLRYESMAKHAANPGGTVGPVDAAEMTEAGLTLIQKANKGELTEDSAREFVNRVLKAANQDVIEGRTVGEFLDAWLEGKKVSGKQRTGKDYQSTINYFKKWLGKKAEKSLSSITAKDIEKFRDARLKQVANGTVADDLKTLRSAFKAASRQGVIQRNVVEAIDLPKADPNERDAFSVAEVEQIVRTTEDVEWKTATLLAFYAGLRLGDAVGLDWNQVDLDQKILLFRQTKTGRGAEIPIHKRLLLHFKSIEGPHSGKVCPKLAPILVKGRNGLSRRFLKIMATAGIDRNVVKPKDGKGRSFSKKSFHSLRHGFVSAMANAGVSEEFRHKLAGHSSAKTHRKYTHLESGVLRKAVNKIPPPKKKAG